MFSKLFVIISNFFKLIYKLVQNNIYNIIKPIKKNGTEFGLHGVFASFGQGKTLTMCKLALEVKKSCNSHNIPCLIYSNMATTFSTKITTIDEIVKIAQEQQEYLSNGKQRQIVILLDEIQTVFNSRNFQSLPIEVIAILCGNRHLNISLYYTVQASFAVDKYFRELSTDFYYARKIGNYFYCYYCIRDRKGLEIMEEWCKVPPLLFAHRYYTINPKDTNNLYNCYNTKENMEDLILQNKGTECNKSLFRKVSEPSISADKDIQKQAYKKLYK